MVYSYRCRRRRVDYRRGWRARRRWRVKAARGGGGGGAVWARPLAPPLGPAASWSEAARDASRRRALRAASLGTRSAYAPPPRTLPGRPAPLPPGVPIQNTLHLKRFNYDFDHFR